MNREYAFYDYGFVLTDEVVTELAQKVTEKEHVEQDPYTIEEAVEYCNDFIFSVDNFIGSAFRIDAEGNADEDENTIYYSGESVYYVPFKKEPKLLKAAYKTIGEIVDELKENDIAQYLPNDFEYKKYLYFICGYYWA